MVAPAAQVAEALKKKEIADRFAGRRGMNKVVATEAVDGLSRRSARPWQIERKQGSSVSPPSAPGNVRLVPGATQERTRACR